jgi:hypothetical protein
MDRNPIHREVRNWTRRRPRVELAQPLAQVAAHVTHHFWSSKPTPDRLSFRSESRNAVENRHASVRIKE